MQNILSGQPKSLEERRAILQREINNYVRRGFRVVSQTDTTAQLIKPKRISLFWAIVWTFLIVGIILYLLWYIVQRDQSVYLEVDEHGRIHKR